MTQPNGKKPYNCHLGPMDHQWKNPPPPFNPEFDPQAKDRYAAVTISMEQDDYYATHTPEECHLEWRRRYELLKKNGHNPGLVKNHSY